MTKVKVLSVNISTEKGTIKKPVNSIELNEQGITSDAHSGDWHRQVSMLGKESFDRFAQLAGRKINFGEFAENITTEGLELVNTKPGDMFIGKNVELEVTQIGKKCHGDSCAIYREVGNCVMPKEGIFLWVKKSGTLYPGDELEYVPKIYKILVITLSDRAYKGTYEDKSGPAVVTKVDEFFRTIKWHHSVDTLVIPDDDRMLRGNLLKARELNYDVVITTGGTGIGPRDITPDVVKESIDKEIPGIMEMIRVKYGAEKPNALISRGVAGIMGGTFVYTLPGSVKAVNEYMNEITKTLQHLFLMRMGIDSH
ncbi:MAG TPA: molybdopterin-binding protein [Tenuifilaceae bacterium]|nr:molybdopterin-binding protein [Tenuifilaceae bacterium]HPE18967.1 molybdopterin-binding protein [Tenuifilaceae bacterium]HPJ46357.1 molybdopterin-binding protein [Tenuifilaceae bacterium]HPQ34817.1 molybdopterin-binding protein [Tenuifilaceae bacterium]HRX68493.1 molybdopterin-binding protein [Tenuifilaceae bacterium]